MVVLPSDGRVADRLGGKIADRLGDARVAITVGTMSAGAVIPSGREAGAEPAEHPYRAAQQRIVDAAVPLFAEHGVGGTSLQMIADAVGVTKAAVYHQFKTKD